MTNESSVDIILLKNELSCLHKRIEESWHEGVITKMYAPADEDNIHKKERYVH